SMPFCAGCTRARLSADGRLYTCLFAANGLDLRGPLRAGAGDEELASLIARAWAERSDRYSEQRAHPGSGPGAAGARASDGNGRRGKGPSKIEMSYIGG
ncbi:MAG: hypothetical protein KGJ43_04985, partial [Acidobacteriota bacterium]|nr:hypothetical protein [Acidobacteriota bacterium]